MRTIKFRGLRTQGEGWVYGYYVHSPDGKHRIYYQPFDEATSNTYHFVKPETLGQFTGLTDNHGNEIFEGDKICYPSYEEDNETVYWDDRELCWKTSPCGLMGDEINDDCEVIGNIHEPK